MRSVALKSKVVVSVTTLGAFLMLTSAIGSVAPPKTGGGAAGGHQPGLTEFDVPGAAEIPSVGGTTPFANNDFGVIVGTWTDANVVPHGFIRNPDGTILSFDAPGAGLGAGLNQGTVAYNINDFGVIAGQFQDTNYVLHAFIRYPTGSFTVFDAPGAGTSAGQGTLAVDINPEGDTAGFYIDSTGFGHGFIRYANGNFATFEAPDASSSGFGTVPCLETCLSPTGAVTGYYFDANLGLHGFVRGPKGTITEFDAPGAATGVTLGGTIAASITPLGVITGYSTDSNYLSLSFIRTPNGRFITFQDPDASTDPDYGTSALAINPFGAVTGVYNDDVGVLHGFERTPQGAFANFTAPDGGAGAFQGTRPSTINALGEVVGWDIDSNNVDHGFLWTPGRLSFAAAMPQSATPTRAGSPPVQFAQLSRFALPQPVRRSLQHRMAELRAVPRLPLPEKLRKQLLQRALRNRTGPQTKQP